MIKKTILLASVVLLGTTAFSKPTTVRKSGGTKDGDGNITYRTVESNDGVFRKPCFAQAKASRSVYLAHLLVQV